MKHHPLSWSGMRLVAGGALHVGLGVTRLLTAKLASNDGVVRHGLLVATAAGRCEGGCEIL